MQNAFVAAADGIVGEGIRKSVIPLTDTLRHCIAITLARIVRDHPGLDRLTLRVTRAIDTAPRPTSCAASATNA